MPIKTAKYAMKTNSTQMAKLTNSDSFAGNTDLRNPVLRGRLPATGAHHESIFCRGVRSRHSAP